MDVDFDIGAVMVIIAVAIVILVCIYKYVTRDKVGDVQIVQFGESLGGNPLYAVRQYCYYVKYHHPVVFRPEDASEPFGSGCFSWKYASGRVEPIIFSPKPKWDWLDERCCSTGLLGANETKPDELWCYSFAEKVAKQAKKNYQVFADRIARQDAAPVKLEKAKSKREKGTVVKKL